MYVGVLVALAGEGILFWSRGLVVEAVLVFIGFNLFVRLHEEPFLARRHPRRVSTLQKPCPPLAAAAYALELPLKPEFGNLSGAASVKVEGGIGRISCQRGRVP